jgi:hypothetical protein
MQQYIKTCSNASKTTQAAAAEEGSFTHTAVAEARTISSASYGLAGNPEGCVQLRVASSERQQRHAAAAAAAPAANGIDAVQLSADTSEAAGKRKRGEDVAAAAAATTGNGFRVRDVVDLEAAAGRQSVSSSSLQVRSACKKCKGWTTCPALLGIVGYNHISHFLGLAWKLHSEIRPAPCVTSAWLGSYTGNLARLGSQWQAHWARKQVQAHKSRKEDQGLIIPRRRLDQADPMASSTVWRPAGSPLSIEVLYCVFLKPKGATCSPDNLYRSAEPRTSEIIAVCFVR